MGRLPRWAVPRTDEEILADPLVWEAWLAETDGWSLPLALEDGKIEA